MSDEEYIKWDVENESSRKNGMKRTLNKLLKEML